MNKSTLYFSILFVFGLLFFVQAQAQVKPMVRTGSGKISPAVAAAAEKQAVIDKVLNATVSKICFKVFGDGYTTSAFSWFKSKSVTVDGNANNKFHFQFFNSTGVTEKYKTTWTEIISGKNNYNVINYKTFLENGFSVKINLKDRHQRIAGKEFTANYAVEFTFTDGTIVTVPLQEFTVEGQQGIWKSTGDVNISKSFAGSVFPDPANPLVLPIIK